MEQIWYGRIVLPNSIIENGQITAVNGRITYVGERAYTSELFTGDSIIYGEVGTLWPGLIDLHVHGAGGADVMDGSRQALSTIAKTLLKYGVTGFLATTVTAPKEKLQKVMDEINQWKRSYGEAEILGIHLEGPWICQKYKGAQNPAYIFPPQKGDGVWAYTTSRGNLRVVTLAPEQPDAHEVIKELVANNVIVSIGHTDATYDQVKAAVHLGASQVTHIFNAMRGLHHREPGVVGAAFALEDLFCEIIVDGHHVHPAAVKALFSTKGTDKTILISDGMRAVDQPAGVYDLGGLRVTTEKGKATLNDGTLAGSLLTLNSAIINSIRYSHIPIWEAVKMASLIPARRLGLDGEIGSIEVGKRANIVASDENGQVKRVWIDGLEEYRREDS